MKKILALMCGCLLSTSAWAQSASWEARTGLIFAGAFMLFYDSEGPLSYKSLTPWELPNDAVLVGEVAGESCQHGVSIPIIFSATDRIRVSGAKGDGSFKKALKDLHVRHPDVAGLYDVKVDVRRISVLAGIYIRDCTGVVALGFRRPGSAKSPALSSE